MLQTTLLPSSITTVSQFLDYLVDNQEYTPFKQDALRCFHWTVRRHHVYDNSHRNLRFSTVKLGWQLTHDAIEGHQI